MVSFIMGGFCFVGLDGVEDNYMIGFYENCFLVLWWCLIVFFF